MLAPASTRLALFVAFTIAAAPASRAQDVDLRTEPLDDPLLSWVIIHGNMHQLDTVPGPWQHWLHLRLVELPVFYTCPGSGAACVFRYLLAVWPDPVGYPEPVFDLGRHRRLEVREWLPSSPTWEHMAERLLIRVWAEADTALASPVEYELEVSPDTVVAVRR
jgi:hypothetical protein